MLNTAEKKKMSRRKKVSRRPPPPNLQGFDCLLNGQGLLCFPHVGRAGSEVPDLEAVPTNPNPTYVRAIYTCV